MGNGKLVNISAENLILPSSLSGVGVLKLLIVEVCKLSKANLVSQSPCFFSPGTRSHSFSGGSILMNIPLCPLLSSSYSWPGMVFLEV